MEKEEEQLEIVPPEIKSAKDAWSSETEFNDWLEENIDVLNDRLGTSFTVSGTEEKAGRLRADFKIEDENIGEGVMETQLGESDHDHLGKLLTYLTGFEKDVAVWITGEARYDHKKVVDWLNEDTSKSLYLVEVQSAKVKDALAPLFTPISMPTSEMEEMRKVKKELTDTEAQQRRFWEKLLKKSNERFPLFRNISPKPQGWIGTGSGVGGVHYTYQIRKNDSDVHLYIDTGSKDENKKIFDELYSKKDEIEQEFGDELEWMRMDDKKASRIRKIISPTKGLDDRDDWDEIQDKMVDGMEKFWTALKDPINEL